MLPESIMQKDFVRNAIINLGERRQLLRVSTLTGAAMPEICAWSVIITGSMSATRNLTMRQMPETNIPKMTTLSA